MSSFPAGPPPRSEAGQALPLVAGAAVTIVLATVALVAIGGAVSGAARVQRVADLAAISAARSMRDDYPRLFVPARLPDGSPNPRHLPQREYLDRAARGALEAGERNGAAAERLRVDFPDRGSFAPLRVRVEVLAELEPGESPDRRPRAPFPYGAAAEATASPPADPSAPRSSAGEVGEGDYRGPLVERQGKRMRPDVARAFDRFSAASRAAGIAVVISSAYRSDAEQAELFASNPDPRWVARPGTSLHRCGTELDLGPPSAYGWLAANAPRFGFVKRYAWEPWHFGYERGPAPCSRAGDRVVAGAGRGDGRLAARGLRGYVPARFRDPIARAASRHDVSAALLAAQLLAESNFNPFAVSPAGAQGIAQFMPGTASAYGLADPFDPAAAIDAQARLMSDLLAQFGSVPLALAAYNAGPAPVAACDCVPAYPETQAYVARILGLLDGAGELAAPALEVRLVE